MSLNLDVDTMENNVHNINMGKIDLVFHLSFRLKHGNILKLACCVHLPPSKRVNNCQKKTHKVPVVLAA